MTTRLKVLSGLLLLSIIYAAVTSIFDSRETKNRNTVSSKNATSLAKTSAQKSKETDDTDAIKGSMESLNKTWQDISQNMYTQDQANPETGSKDTSKTETDSKGDVKDADFEVVDDEK